ncbi:MAG: universal stress protein [Candidatus Thiodiazotropha sp. (ex Epidulcina cf. delphinae)]|nr:universal stress protein [Candidatus Thiodiazotropha sp. (ex Epidulcina cf. delphinae)]
MSAQVRTEKQASDSLPGYESILLAVDSSDYANRGVIEAVDLAGLFKSRLTAAHVYAAKLHDLRFRQMEGGLPEPFREEQELERQRDVHDDLITRGLSIITDSYLDQVDHTAGDASIPVARRSLEGKNYRELVHETNSGHYDLLVMGALGLGAVKGSRLGTVCQRVSRRSRIDTLIIKSPTQSLKNGPIVVGIDGSAKSYGGLLTALSMAKAWGVELKVVSAFDPYYHYVAFNRIAGVLSDEAGEVFKFKEQEKLHEEIIDSGLAKIYQGHLAVAQSIANDWGMEIETVLLDGKPHEVINRYLLDVKPSLLVLGTTGIHADSALDIGGNSEYLLNDAACAVLLSQREHKPQVDRLASVSTSWTHEAEARMERVPSFVRSMARMAILRYAQEKGHTVITESIVEEATAQLMPGHAEQAMSEIVEAYDRGELKRKPDAEAAIRWSEAATKLLLGIDDLSLRGNLSMRAEKKARAAGSRQVEAAHIQSFLDDDRPVQGKASVVTTQPSLSPQDEKVVSPPHFHWHASALACLMRVPEGFMRDSCRQRIETYAQQQGVSEISLDTAEAGLEEARKAMLHMQSDQQPESSREESACPFAGLGKASNGSDKTTSSELETEGAVKTQWQQRGVFHLDPSDPGSQVHGAEKATQAQPITDDFNWQAAALARLMRVPEGFMRDLTRQRIETYAGKKGLKDISLALVEEKYAEWSAGSSKQTPSMAWDEEAKARMQRIPEVVRGMVMLEVERCARKLGLEVVNREAVEKAGESWRLGSGFHSESNPDQYR